MERCNQLRCIVLGTEVYHNYMSAVCVVAVHAIVVWRGSTGTAVQILNLDTRWRWVEYFRFTPGKDTRYPFELEASWAPEPGRRFREQKNIMLRRRFEPRIFQTVA